MLIYLTGGKTLGHITPLINIFNKFKDKHSFVYFGLESSLEEELCLKYSITFVPLKLKGLNRKNIFKNFEVFNLIRKSNKIVKKQLLNSPDLIIASSGFVCIPLLYKSKKIPIFLLEQNTTLGLVNRLFYYKCSKLFLSLPIEKKLKKSILSGNFVINDDFSYDNIEFYSNKPLMLLLFGSMGSSSLYKFFENHQNLFSSYKVFIVLPNKFYDDFTFSNFIKLRSINNICNIFNKFDVIISRAGATTIYELLNCNSKVLLIPSPNVVNDHQVKNALLMKKNFLMDFINEDELDLIEDRIKNLSIYNSIDKRLSFIKDSFSILDDSLNSL